MSKTSKNPRSWPVLIISVGNIVHISRANSDEFGKVHTECGRCMHHSGSLSATPEEILDTDGKTITRHKVWTYKFCSRCGSKEEFAEAQSEFKRAMEERRRNEDERHESQKSMLQKMQRAIRATIIATALPEGADEVDDDGWGIKFTLNGTRFQLSPVAEEQERLYGIAQEEGKKQWQEQSKS